MKGLKPLKSKFPLIIEDYEPHHKVYFYETEEMKNEGHNIYSWIDPKYRQSDYLGNIGDISYIVDRTIIARDISDMQCVMEIIKEHYYKVYLCQV